MCIRIMSLVWGSAPHCGNQLLVLLALADWANESGVCWPSVATLAKKTKISKRSAQYIIRALQKEGYISIVEGGGRHRQNLYQISLQKLHPVENGPQLHNETERSHSVQTNDGVRMQSPHKTVQQVASDPSEDPPLLKTPIQPPETGSLSNSQPAQIQRLLTYLSRKIGPIPDRKKQEDAVTWLLDNGYDVVECEACFDELTKEKWRNQAVTWLTVKSQIGNWLSKSSFNPSPRRLLRGLNE
jgi:hypothetical protein